MAEVWAWPSGDAGTPRYIERLPDGTASVVFRGAGSSRPADLSAAGAVSRAVYKQGPHAALVVAVVFKLGGAYPFFGVPMHLLTDQIVPLEELWGGDARDLFARLVDAQEDFQALQSVEHALVARLERAGTLELRAAVHALRGVRRLVETQQDLDVAGLASGVGLSERQLRRVFATAVGVGPKKYLQMLRFNRAIRASPMPGGQLAAASGYHDQAHLISEFRHLARMTPRDFANRRREESPRSNTAP